MSLKHHNHSFHISLEHSGFTLIEMLLVVAIISILITFIFSTISPTVQLNKAHNVNRRNAILQLTNAIYQYSIDTSPLTNVPEGISNAKDICRIHLQGSACTGAPVNGYDLSYLIPTYITPLPSDQFETNSSITGYRIYRDHQFIRVCNTRLYEWC